MTPSYALPLPWYFAPQHLDAAARGDKTRSRRKPSAKSHRKARRGDHDRPLKPLPTDSAKSNYYLKLPAAPHADDAL